MFKYVINKKTYKTELFVFSKVRRWLGHKLRSQGYHPGIGGMRDALVLINHAGALDFFLVVLRSTTPRSLRWTFSPATG